MTKHATIIRYNAGLDEADAKIVELLARYRNVNLSDKSQWANTSFAFTRQLYNMLQLARVIVQGARLRDESRGAHYKPDFPERNDEKFLKTTKAAFTDGAPSSPSSKTSTSATSNPAHGATPPPPKPPRVVTHFSVVNPQLCLLLVRRFFVVIPQRSGGICFSSPEATNEPIHRNPPHPLRSRLHPRSPHPPVPFQTSRIASEPLNAI